DESQCFFAIDLRPDTFLPTGREALYPGRLALGSFQPIDPTVAKGNLDGLGIGDRLRAGCLLGDPHPDPFGGALVFREPRVPRRRILEGSNRGVDTASAFCGLCLQGLDLVFVSRPRASASFFAM